MSQSKSPPTAYPSTSIKPQNQEVEPAANWTQLEFWDDEGTEPYLKEYEGRDLLKAKAILITGGDSGVGRSGAILMAREGADVSFVYLPEEEEDAQAAKKEIEKAGRKAQLMALDITMRENCQKAIDAQLKTFGKLSVLVNNSAMQEVCEDITEINLDVVQKTFKTNLIAMFTMVKLAVPHMKPLKLHRQFMLCPIATFTRSLAQQLAPKGIRVSAVAPGIIWTPLQPAIKGNQTEAMEGLGTEAAPLQRPGMPIEVAGAYLFLASPMGSYFTGEVIHGTGGIEMQG
ncbi:hypothetical protein MMC30_006254 [Trapelia coarctata]|nr:hypothetical protein [Trapelia coarctata]